MEKSEQAVNTFTAGGFNCAQSVFSTYSEHLGFDSQTALKISCSFGGGMGHIGETCGAVTGAFMLIGLKYGQINPEDTDSKEKVYALVQEFTRQFKEQYGSVKCKDLLGCDMSTPDGLKFVKERGLTKMICPKYVRSAARIIENLLLNENQNS
ncbi:MAG: C-GCAxxG-C-C family protein [Bacillota bacterium]